MDPGGAIGWDQGGMHAGKEDAAHNKVDPFSWSFVMMKRKLYKRPSPFWQSFFDPRADRAPQEFFYIPGREVAENDRICKEKAVSLFGCVWGAKSVYKQIATNDKDFGSYIQGEEAICSE